MPMEEESPEELGYHTIAANLAESSCSDIKLADILQGSALNDLVLLYGDHRGHEGLRRIIADDAAAQPHDVLVTMGAVMALYVIHNALLGAGEHLIVVRPNYATNLETPYALGADVDFIDLDFNNNYALDPARVAALLRPNTRLVSFTTPHNPTGVAVPPATIQAIIAMTTGTGTHVLVDETYREMTYGPPPARLWAAEAPHVISVSSVSKTYGAPGLRVGWIACRDAVLMKTMLAIKEQITLVGSVVDEALAFTLLSQRSTRLPAILIRIAVGKATTEVFMAKEQRLQWIKPDGGVVGFPRVRPELHINEAVFAASLARSQTMVGAGHWFGLSDRCFRLGWGWPSADELSAGLVAISRALDEAM
jgi:aspartate/methionine/tyrosine aminotransferase